VTDPQKHPSSLLGALPARDPNVDTLVGSAKRCIAQALSAWADEDESTVAMLAPIAVEHLGKAVLWSRNPALLVPLSNNAEESLRILACQPDLTNAALRTIGLDVVLQRLSKLLDSVPWDNDGRQVLSSTRNGSVHVGVKGSAKRVLRAALASCSVLLVELGLDARNFFGDQEGNVRNILDEQRTEVQGRVDAKIAKARNYLGFLEETLGENQFKETTDGLEAERSCLDNLWNWSTDIIGIDHSCPECGCKGRLIGHLDADPQVDWDYEPGSEEPYVSGSYWLFSLAPEGFGCNVCRLLLDSPDELRAARVPSTRIDIETTAFDEDFDVDEFVRRSERDDY
jgi:hypothetical protein